MRMQGGAARRHASWTPRTFGGTLTRTRTLLDCAHRTVCAVRNECLEASLGRFDRQDRRAVAVVMTTDGRRVHMPVTPGALTDVSILALLRLGLDGLLGLITGSRRENGGMRRDRR